MELRHLLLTLSMLLTACLGDSQGYRTLSAPAPEFLDGEHQIGGADALHLALTWETRAQDESGHFDILNAGHAPLLIESMAVEGPDASRFTLTAERMPSAESPLTIAPLADGGVALRIGVRVDPDGLHEVATATVAIRTNPDASGTSVHYILLKAVLAQPALSLAPSHLEFGTVPVGSTEESDLLLINTGNHMLAIEGFSLTGDGGYSVVLDGLSLGQDALPQQGLESLVLAPGQSLPLPIRYHASTVLGATASLKIFSNDPTLSEGLVVQLSANTGGPCILVEPGTLDFGGKLVGTTSSMDVTITSCGDQPLVLRGGSLQGHDAFSLGGGLAARFPMTIAVNETVQIPITFIPPSVSSLQGDGTLEWMTATLTLATNTLSPTVETPLHGFGMNSECPIPVLKIEEGEEVCPQTKLHLQGSQSYAPDGPLAGYDWTVIQPNGSVAHFLPSASAPDPAFTPNVAGKYVFRLQVTSQNGAKTGSPMCPNAEFVVNVIPCDSIHVELLWDTPGDVDQSDEGPEAGADLDLHFVHPFAQGFDVDGDGQADGYFDTPFDAYWFNVAPNWGSMDPLVMDDPSLDRDDTDGAGPENLNLDTPQDGMVYKVGVHYWNDHGFGPSSATVRIYIETVLVYEAHHEGLTQCDLWEVASIHWPSGQVVPLNDSSDASVVHDFCAPPGWQ